MRICFNTKDAFWCPSAYAKLAEYLVGLIKEHEWVIQSPVGMSGGKAIVGDIPIYGKFLDIKGEDVAEQIFRSEKCDIYMTVADVWWYNRIDRMNFPWVAIATIDYERLPDFVVERLKRAFAVIPPYRKAEKLLKKAGVETLPATYYCGCDTNCYRPFSDEKAEILSSLPKTRQSMFENAEFGITIVAMNSRRKCFETMFEAVKIFQEQNPDITTAVWVHAMPNVTTEYDLMKLAKAYGVKVRFPDPFVYSYGFDEEDMARIYNASDCLLSLTGGESGNLVAVEAQACGVPVVATNYTINPEVCPRELLVPVADYYYTPNPPLMKARADVYKAAEKLEDVLNSNPDRWLRVCRKNAEQFDWHKIAVAYKERLDEIEDLLELECVKPPIVASSSEVVVL